ncbi:hypothetical protein BGZ65_004414 [Modicella reniformis]|uniref:Uncharacterized protein n=1 Tax=Modicella reniformis TaxID=1440133 RepID=A0A9P6MLM2_9FUNG|nr:hypothetical protein BGZ65_004414 [Modicella reniformis]
MGSPVPFSNHVRTNSVGSPQLSGASGAVTSAVAIGATSMEGAGLGLAALNANINSADHGRISPALKDGASTLLPPKTAELFARNDKGVLWFAGPPLDIVPMPRPHHSVEYLAKRQKLQNGKARRTNANGSRAGEGGEVNGINGIVTAAAIPAPDVNVDDVLPVVMHGLEALKDQLNRDVQAIQSN